MLVEDIQKEVESGVESNRIPRQIRSRGDDVSIWCTWDFYIQFQLGSLAVLSGRLPL